MVITTDKLECDCKSLKSKGLFIRMINNQISGCWHLFVSSLSTRERPASEALNVENLCRILLSGQPFS